MKGKILMSEIEKYMDTDFIETQGKFSLNPTQITNIEYFENALYFSFNNSDMASMRIKFTCEEHAKKSLEDLKLCVARKVLTNDR